MIKKILQTWRLFKLCYRVNKQPKTNIGIIHVYLIKLREGIVKEGDFLEGLKYKKLQEAINQLEKSFGEDGYSQKKAVHNIILGMCRNWI